MAKANVRFISAIELPVFARCQSVAPGPGNSISERTQEESSLASPFRLEEGEQQ